MNKYNRTIANKKDVKYLNKDFNSLRESLINFAKIYFPQTYNDFNAASPGMMFIEMASYVGDVLSFYIDKQFQESLLLKAQEYKNVVSLSQAFGYIPKVSIPSYVNLDIFMVVPSTGSGTTILPNYNYAITIKSGFEVKTDDTKAVTFRTIEDAVFSDSDSYDKSDVIVYETTAGEPTSFLLKKTVKAMSVTQGSVELDLTKIKRYNKALINIDNIVSINTVYEKNNEDIEWYEVDYLAQDTIFEDNPIKDFQNFDSGSNKNTVPYILSLRRVPRRYILRVNDDGYYEMHFGSGMSSNPDEIIVPNPANVGGALANGITKFDSVIDPSNFLYSRTYGQVPQTTLVVNYLYGGGIESNVEANTITSIISDLSTDTDLYDIPIEIYSASSLSSVIASISVNNKEAATGGRAGETVEEIRQNALALFNSQQRVVTKEDYITRLYSMPAKYGSISKAYIEQSNNINIKYDNPLSMNLYVLGYDSSKNLTILNDIVKSNIISYLDRYRMLTDAVNILDAHIINIGVNFKIITSPAYNKNDVILRCISQIYDFFNIDNWQINQPIVISDLYKELLIVDGVQNVNEIKIINKFNEDNGYSGNLYNIDTATKDGVVFPSKDPSIFELKYRKDIRGYAR